MAKRPKVLVTGAAGNIGSYFVKESNHRYDLRLFVHTLDDRAKALNEFGEVINGDLSDEGTARKACGGMDVVLHLAGVPDAFAKWDDLLPANILASYHLFTSAVEEGCKKIIFASSIHAVSGYPAGVQVKTTDPVNPGDLYGVTKCFGEAMGRYLSTQKGIAFLALRIGAFQPSDEPSKGGSMANADGFVSRRDLQQLLERCLDDQKLQFGIFQALSGNTFNRMDISDGAELLGYLPIDDFFESHPELKETGISREVRAHNLSDKSPEDRDPQP